MQFEQFLISMGLQPRHIAPGKWVRCPTESHPRSSNGSYKLADDCQVGWAMDFAAHDEPIMWRAENKEFPTIDRSAIARRKAQAEQDKHKATQGALEYYMSCEPVRGGHDYLDGKELSMTGCTGLKRDPKNNALVVPMYVGRQVVSVQTIHAEGKKRFWSGAPTKGATFTIERSGAPMTILCEGLATGLTLYAAVPTARVIVAFSSGNLLPASQHITRGMAAVAADNDHATELRIGTNPGVKAAQAAAQALGCGVAIPQCQGSDWNDYASERMETLKQAEVTKKRPRTFADLMRDVDAEIRSAVMRQAKMKLMARG